MLKSLDNLSPQIALYYRGYDRHASSISGFLSIITYSAIAILGVVFSLDFILKKNPTSYFFNRFQYDIGTFPFNSSGIFHFIVTGEQTNEPYDDKVFSIIGINEEYDVIKEKPNSILYDHWIYESCNNLHIGKLKEYLDDYNSSFYNGLCISKFYNKTTKKVINFDDQNFNFPKLIHGNSNPNGNTYGIFLLRCQNHTELEKNDCYDNQSSDSKGLDAYSFSIYFIDQYVDVTNYHYPLTRFYNKVRNQITLSSYTVNHLNLKPLQIATHSGILINSDSQLTSFNFDVNEKFTIEEPNSGIYGSFYFWMQNQVGIYDRTYQKIQDISASISGISKLLMVIGYFVNYLFAEYTLVQDLYVDITKKIDKYGKSTNSRGFKSLKSLNFSYLVNSNFQIEREKTFNNVGNNNLNNNNLGSSSINSNSKINNNIQSKNYVSPLYNNMVEGVYPKGTLNIINLNKNKNSVKKPTLKKILNAKLCCIKNNYITKLINIRTKVLSEEKLFSSYYILGALSDIFMKHFMNEKMQRNSKIQNRKNKFWTPQQNAFINFEKI